MAGCPSIAYPVTVWPKYPVSRKFQLQKLTLVLLDIMENKF